MNLIITDRERVRPLQVIVHLFVALKKHFPAELELRDNLERLIGISSFRRSIDDLRSPEEILAKLDRLMLQVHVNDNEGGQKQQNLIPGDGTYDFGSLIQVLREHNFSGFLSAELSKGYADDPDSSRARYRDGS